MKICVCTVQVPFVRGGAESMAENLIKALQERGHQVEQINIPFKWYPKEQLVRDSLVWRLLDLSESYAASVDLIIATKFPSYLVKHSCKVVWLTHQFREIYDCFGTHLSGFSSSEEDTFIRQTLVDWDSQALLEAKRIFTISQNVSKRLLHFNGLESQHLYVPVKRLGEYLPPVFENFILCPGRLELSKRVDLLIRTMPYLPATVSCLIVGTGPQSGHLQELSLELGVSDRVRFLGYVTDQELLELYSRACLVYFAPYDEDLGLITLEAFQARKPVVTCSDSGAVLEFVEHDRTGKVAQTKPEQIAHECLDLIEHKERARELGQNGFECIQSITWSNVLDRLLADLP
ncbi:glycosyltransferase family 4 protein [bacterium]|nr:glycosyltransferase family 4 protein [bacterium]